MRRDPAALEGLGIAEIADHYATLVRGVETPPILMGHSFGGLIVQILLDRGLGAAGVAIDSAPPKGILRLPLSALRAASAVLKNPANYKRTVALTFAQFRHAFANVMTESDARAAYDRYAIPGPGRPIFQTTTANLNPRAATKVNYLNRRRAPLLLIAGSDDHQFPPSLSRDSLGKYARSPATTELKEFPHRSHLIIAQAGWEEVADQALAWAQTKAAKHQPVLS